MIKVFNTLTKSKEEFKPINPGKVLFYQCGPTVYWAPHLGNMRAAVLGDFIRRALIYNNFDVKYCRNYTDVGHLTSDADVGEDKIEKGVKREGLSPEEIITKYIKLYEDNIKNLNTLDPDFKPRATEVMSEIIDMVKTLVEKGFAYETDLAVYFDVSKFPNYTQLSRQNLEESKSGAGTGEVSDSQKKNSVDFALWFFRAGVHENALQYWPSPFHSKLAENGIGFPGWHIECSAMVRKFLGITIDIHMGGVEHISIHHTNEIAQSESANGVKYVNYWVHNEHLFTDEKKMSKSEGTSYVLQDIIDRGYDPLVLRYFFLQAHYRSKQNLTWEALEAASNGYKNLKNQVQLLGLKKGTVNEEFKNKFIEKISDDFNIPQALALVADLLKADLSDSDKLATILDFDKVFGLKLDEIEEEKIPKEIIKLAEERLIAKKQKDYSKADEIRGKIEKQGFIIEDLVEGKYKISKK